MKAPGFLAAVVISMAIGTSANIAVFSWIQALLLRPLPGVEQGGRLVTLETTAGGQYLDTSYPDFKSYRDQSRSLSGLNNGAEKEVLYGQTANARGADFILDLPNLERTGQPFETRTSAANRRNDSRNGSHEPGREA